MNIQDMKNEVKNDIFKETYNILYMLEEMKKSTTGMYNEKTLKSKEKVFNLHLQIISARGWYNEFLLFLANM